MLNTGLGASFLCAGFRGLGKNDCHFDRHGSAAEPGFVISFFYISVHRV
jgi:hypothetical protein